MKKLICVCLVAVLALGILTGCGANKGNDKQSQDKSTEAVADNNAKDNLNKFDTVDADGNKVTQDIFKDKDITMVNIWATWCGACIGEMGEIQELYKEVQKKSNINMISICEDLGDKPEIAKSILKGNKCTFTTLQPDESIRKNLLNNLQYFPTTIFVDSEGNIVGEPISGAPSGDVAEYYMEKIEDALKKVKK